MAKRNKTYLTNNRSGSNLFKIPTKNKLKKQQMSKNVNNYKNKQSNQQEKLWMSKESNKRVFNIQI